MHNMAKNPRLTMTLTPTVAAQLRRLSELTGNSQAALVSELLEGQTVVFSRVIQVLEAAQAAKGEVVERLSQSMQEAQSQIEAQLGLTLETFDSGVAPLIEAAEQIRRRRGRRTATTVGDAEASPAGGAVRRPTPISNRGVRLERKQAKKSTGTRS